MAESASDLTPTGKDHSAAWDWENKYVSETFTRNGKGQSPSVQSIVESGTVLICAAPANLATTSSVANGSFGANGNTQIVPIGMVEQASVQQSRPLSRIFEIGSKLSYIIPGRTVGQIALARVLFDGPSLLKCLYQGEVESDSQYGDGTKNVLFRTRNNGAATQSDPGVSGVGGGYQAISSGNIGINLASSFFDQKVGLVFMFHDRNNDEVGSIYFEGCLVSSHSLGISAGMNVLTESIALDFVRAVPVVTATGTTSNSDESISAGSLYDIPIIGFNNTNSLSNGPGGG